MAEILALISDLRDVMCIKGGSPQTKGKNMKAATATKTSAAAVSRVLAKAGVSRSASSATRVRGYHYTSEGFEATNGSSAVIVKWEMGNSANFSKNWERLNERKTAAVESMYQILINAGFQVNITDSKALIVIKPIKCDCGCDQAVAN